MSSLPRFAALGATPLFSEVKPTGNLFRPDIEKFLAYSRAFYRTKRYTDDGDLCRRLAQRLAQFHDVQRVVCVNSGFWGHVLAMSALALPGRREIITPAFCYRRTDDMIAWSGFVPHFCDVDPDTLGLSPETIKPALNGQTALILAPHPMVNCCDASGIEEFGRTHGIPVVFDSVEAAYRTHNDRQVGGFGDAEIFSMHSTKLLNAFEGGYVTTNNGSLADRLEKMKHFGFDDVSDAEDGQGLNAKLIEMHAAAALASLDDVNEQVALNRRKYQRYLGGLRGIQGLSLVEHNEIEGPDYRLIVVRIGVSWPLSREETLRVLQAENALARPYYTPLNRRAVAYHRLSSPLPVTDAIFQQFMVLPSGAHVAEEDVDAIVGILRDISRHGAQLKSLRKAE